MKLFIFLFSLSISALSAQTKAQVYLIHTESGIEVTRSNSSDIGGIKLTSKSSKSQTVFNVFANGNKICKSIRNNKYKVYDIAPGNHELSVKMGLFEKKAETLKLDVEAGKVYYVLMNLEVKMFKDVFTFTQINKDDFSAISDLLKLAKKGC